LSHKIDEYLFNRSWRTSENSNFNRSFSGLQSYIVDNILAKYALKRMPREASRAHINGDIHIHDLNSGNIVPYCYGADLKALLLQGAVSADVQSKPAKHLSTAVDHMVNFFYMSQLEWAGAQAFSDVNTLLSPFVWYDKLEYVEVRQAIQRLVWNLNFASRQAFQRPFTNITINLRCPKQLSKEPVVIGGKVKEETYSDYEEEADMITLALCDVLLERDSKGRPFTFPIPTLNIHKDVDWSSKVLRAVADVSRQLGSFYFMNYNGSGINEDTIRAMCCRLNLDLTQVGYQRGFWNFQGGTGSLGVCTLNMSRIGYLSKEEGDIFDRILDLLEISKLELQWKDKQIRRFYKKGMMPFAKFYNVNFDRFFKTIGVIGLNEMCINFTGKRIHEEVDLVEKVLRYIRDWITETQHSTGELWNFELIPGEGSSYRLAFIDRKKYRNIKTLGTKRAPYYSTLVVPPKYSIPFSERLSVEEKLLPIFTGGTIFRNYIGEKVPNLDSTLAFIKNLSETKIPYFDLTPTFSVCPNEGVYYPGKVDVCPRCGSKMEIYSRVVGYYRPSHKYNIGKKKEFEDRKYLDIGETFDS